MLQTLFKRLFNKLAIKKRLNITTSIVLSIRDGQNKLKKQYQIVIIRKFKKKCKYCGVKLYYIAANYKHGNYNGKKTRLLGVLKSDAKIRLVIDIKLKM